jgi:PAS domain S-box-containing protein
MIRSGVDFSFSDALLDSISDPIFLLDSDRHIVVWNKAMEGATGLLAQEVIDDRFSNHFLVKNLEYIDHIDETSPTGRQVSVNNRDFRLIMERISCSGTSCLKGTLHALNHGVLKSLPSEYLVEIINASPISSIVFNLDGSILYSNNAYKKLWKLTEEDLNFVNNKYNLFLDKQLSDYGLMPFINSAFAGNKQDSHVFNYRFNSTTLGRNDNNPEYRLMTHLYPILDNAGKTVFVVLSFIDVTENHELEQAYRVSRERLQLALEGANLGTWDWDLRTNKKVYNDRWANMLGYTLEEVYDIGWEKLLHPDDRQSSRELMAKFSAGELDEYESEYRLLTKYGAFRWILDRGKIVERSGDGVALRGAGTHIDITDRKVGEQKVAESESKYRRLVENAPIGVAIILDEKLVYINERLAEMGEVQEIEEVIGAPVRNFMVDEEGYQTFKERASLVMEHGENAPLYSTQFKTINGNHVDVEVVSIPTIFNEKRAIQVLFHDITERKQVLKELSRSQQLLNQLFENSPMGIVLLDEQFRVRNVNKGFEKLFGFTNEQVHKQSLSKYIVPPEVANEASNLNKSAINGEIDYVESYRIDKNGNKKHLLIYALPVIEANEHIGVYGIYIDIGQRVEAENELRTRNLELDNFVYKVSHDLRAPLASILGLINLTKIEVNSSDKEYYISLMEGQVNKLDHFIRDILSHSKNLKMSLSADVVDFNDIVNKCFEDLGYLEAASHIERDISIDSGTFISDKWRVNEIFRNLISNAIKYYNPEISENKVEISIKLHKDHCDILVADNGIGIPEEKIPHVLDMFYRGTETSDGSGIGLYIVQKAVEKLNGELKIESTPMVGTKFQISLPSMKI